MHRSIVALLVLACTTVTTRGEPEAEAEAQAEPQMSMNPYIRPSYNPYLPGRTQGQVGPSPCEMTNQCCGFAKQGCCMGGRKTYTVWKRKCDRETSRQQCRTRVERFCSKQMVKDCRIESTVEYMDFEAEQCIPRPLRKCFTYQRKVCQPSTFPASRNVTWTIDELVMDRERVEQTCREMTSYNCTPIETKEIVKIPVTKTRIIPDTRQRCGNVRVPGESETRTIPFARIVYEERCYDMPQTQCSQTGGGCSTGRCPQAQVPCPFANAPNAYKNTTVCPFAQQRMAPSGQRPNYLPTSPCQAVRQLDCGGNPIPGGPCNAPSQQCCQQRTRRVCQRVPRRVVETQTVTVPSWKWERRCENITIERTEYYTETEEKETTKTRQDCKKVTEEKCFNITIPEYSVRKVNKAQMVSVQLPRCQPRTEQATYCHNFPQGDVECKKVPVKKGFRINKIVCDREATRPYCLNIPRMDCELKPGMECRMVPETVTVPSCSNSPTCQTCNNFTNSGPGFRSCPTSTCDSYIDPQADNYAFSGNASAESEAGIFPLDGQGGSPMSGTFYPSNAQVFP